MKLDQSIVDMVDIANVDIERRLSELCIANSEARVHTLLYVSMVSNNGHVITGHVDLAERVAKLFWKDGIKDKTWILPKIGDLTYKRRCYVNYCSSMNWDVVIKDNVVKLVHIKSGCEILVGATIKKKWSKIKNRILKHDNQSSKQSSENSWKVLVNENSFCISYFNVIIAEN